MAQCPESEMSDDSTVQADAILQAEASIRSDATDRMNRDEIVRRFERWLDAVLSAEAPPEGIDAGLLSACTDANADPDWKPDEPNDAYAVWSAVTALTQEIKLQGRAFKELQSTLGTEAARAAEELRAVDRERQRDIQRDAERRCRKEILSALIDLRDSLHRGLETVRAVQPDLRVNQPRKWSSRFFKARHKEAAIKTLSALTTGYQLGLQRLDQVLADFKVDEIVCRGQPFDPRRMNAVDRASSDAPEGTVLEVYRSGYEWNGEVFRPAQVKVSVRGDYE